jgi:lysophospholipase L1-like esterase
MIEYMQPKQPKAVLCYGDSNVRGTKPDKSGRFDYGIRWTTILQKMLSFDYYVIEEGLGGRTTNLDHIAPDYAGRNGYEYFKPCLESHMPLDYIILMMGTAEWKTAHNRSAADTVEATRNYIDFIHKIASKKPGPIPQITLVSPARINVHAKLFDHFYRGIYDESSAQKSADFPPLLRKLASELDCDFLDAGEVARVGADGIHIREESQPLLADAIKCIIIGDKKAVTSTASS